MWVHLWSFWQAGAVGHRAQSSLVRGLSSASRTWSHSLRVPRHVQVWVTTIICKTRVQIQPQSGKLALFISKYLLR